MTNEELIKEYNNDLRSCPSWTDDDEVNTYQGWLKNGRQVRKGEKAKGTLTGRGSSHKSGKVVFYDKTLYLFTKAQTESVDTPATEKVTSYTKKSSNIYGVEVGQLFSSSWGYDQTNVDFFQVIELIGKTKVRVVEVNPQVIASDSVSSMSEDNVYLTTKELLPHARTSVFIKDQEKGDIKILKNYSSDEKHPLPQFKLSTFASAYIVTDDTTKMYKSWYA